MGISINEMNTTTNISQETRLHWDEFIARKFANLLSSFPITANQITLLAFLLTLLSGYLFTSGEPWKANIAALIFMLVRFLDHLDGEVARIKKSESRFGHYFDWFVDTFSYVFLFITLGIGFRNVVSPVLLALIVSLAVIACIVNTLIGLVKENKKDEDEEQSFPTIGGFSIDDSMYLIGPLTWIGFLFPFFLVMTLGSVIYMVYVFLSMIYSRL